jgi:hypothetical protein
MFDHDEKDIKKLLAGILVVLEDIRDELHHKPILTRISIKLIAQEDSMLSPAITLNVGQTQQVTVVGFDQNGNLWTQPLPAPNWSIDQPGVASIAPDPTTPTNEDVTGVAVGTANLTAGLTNAQGTALTATAQVTVTASTTPVLTSIQIQPVASAAASAAVKK